MNRHHLHLPITIMAGALPSTPGFIGTFHFACRTALALFGVQALTAVSFATVYHLFTLILCLLLGLISYLTCSFRFDRNLFSTPNNQSGDTEGPLEMVAPRMHRPNPLNNWMLACKR